MKRKKVHISSFISVVMPLYNHCDYVAEAVNSILNQTHDNIELIIVDDGSTDGSSDIVKDLATKDGRIRYIYQQNGGTGIALNTGFSMANGKYGTWVSSDNIYYPRMLEIFFNFLCSNNSSFVFSAFDMMRGGAHVHTFQLDCIYEPTILSDFIDRCSRACITGMCYLYTMDLKNECGDFLDVPGEDYHMGVMMGLKTAVGYIPTPLGVYRMHDNSVTHRVELDASLHAKENDICAGAKAMILIEESKKPEEVILDLEDLIIEEIVLEIKRTRWYRFKKLIVKPFLEKEKPHDVENN